MIRHIPTIGRALRAGLKCGLAGLGGCMLIQLYADRWGSAAGLWFLGALFIYTIAKSLIASRPSPPRLP
jgi:hypothetical protein